MKELFCFLILLQKDEGWQNADGGFWDYEEVASQELKCRTRRRQLMGSSPCRIHHGIIAIAWSWPEKQFLNQPRCEDRSGEKCKPLAGNLCEKPTESDSSAAASVLMRKVCSDLIDWERISLCMRSWINYKPKRRLRETVCHSSR